LSGSTGTRNYSRENNTTAEVVGIASHLSVEKHDAKVGHPTFLIRLPLGNPLPAIFALGMPML